MSYRTCYSWGRKNFIFILNYFLNHDLILDMSNLSEIFLHAHFFLRNSESGMTIIQFVELVEGGASHFMF